MRKETHEEKCMFLVSLIAVTLAAAGTPHIQLEVGLIEADDIMFGKLPIPSHPAASASNIVARGENATALLLQLKNSPDADILTWPLVATSPGTNATLKVVTEFKYPTELALRHVSVTNDQKVVRSVEILPARFESRDVGVTLHFKSMHGPKDGTIDLDLTGEIVSEPTSHLQYTLKWESADGNTQTLPLKIPVGFLAHPIAISILLDNGIPVILDGGIRKYTVRVEDRVPILGAIPGIGRLFCKSRDVEGERRLLIAITAQTVDDN